MTDLCLEPVSSTRVLSIPEALLDKSNISVFRVHGDGMSGDHLLDGDCVIVQTESVPKDDDLVVVSIGDGKRTIKRFTHTRECMKLEEANPSRAETNTEEENVTVPAVVVGILRKFGDT